MEDVCVCIHTRTLGLAAASYAPLCPAHYVCACFVLCVIVRMDDMCVCIYTYTVFTSQAHPDGLLPCMHLHFLHNLCVRVVFSCVNMRMGKCVNV